MEFTYSAYIDLINILKKRNYEFTNYKDYKRFNRSVIFRHDIDNSLEKALKLAKLEFDNDIKSTYFVLLSTDLYNIFSKKSNGILKDIVKLGHSLGLHFDEKRYDITNKEELENYIKYETNILEEALEQTVDIVSMHRPSKWILENNIEFTDILNSYSKTFLKDFKYLSDSRMHWREDVLEIIDSEKYNRLHILTHPFWYEESEGNIEGRVGKFIRNANKERYYQMKDNIRDIREIVEEGEII